MKDASILTANGRPSVRLERELTDSPSVVWKALTDREQLRSWFPCDVVVEGDVGLRETWDRTAAAVRAEFAGVDIVVNNAAAGH